MDRDTRGGEVVTHADDISRTGVLIYADTIADVFPRCGLDDPPPIPFVTVDEALAGTLVHEIGHTLQLGHDTEAQGGEPVQHYVGSYGMRHDSAAGARRGE